MNVFQSEEVSEDALNCKGLRRETAATNRGSHFYMRPLTGMEKVELGIADFYRPYMGITAEKEHIPVCYRWFKRAIDFVLCIVAMAFFSPLIALCMVAIVLEDPHESPIFRQIRVGQDGKPFVMYKLRSMYAGSEKRLHIYRACNEAQEKAFKMRNDPRVTRVGGIMRKLSIDELPQLLNVIKGDMSIVGPRPPLPGEVAQYDAYDLQRLAIRPGLTCYWQIHPRRHEISFEDWVAMDIKYI